MLNDLLSQMAAQQDLSNSNRIEVILAEIKSRILRLEQRLEDFGKVTEAEMCAYDHEFNSIDDKIAEIHKRIDDLETKIMA